METGYLSDDEIIDVENDSDSGQVNQNVIEKPVTPTEKFGEKPMDTKTGNGLDKTCQKSSDKTRNFIKRTGTFSQQKSMISFRNHKTTSGSTDINRNSMDNSNDEFSNILFGIMNKLFSARVVLKRLPSPVAKKMEPVEKPLAKNKNEKTSATHETNYIFLEGIAYVRLCPKCEEKPPVRKSRRCLSCKTELIFECQKCHKQFRTYRLVYTHLNNKCFIKKLYHCSVCSYTVNAHSKVKRHMLRLHPSKYSKETVKWTDGSKSLSNECSQCGKKFGNYEFLNRHIPLCNKSQEICKSKPNEQIHFKKLIIKFCPKCEKDTQVYHAGVSNMQPCQKCGSAINFRCSRCSQKYECYNTVYHHTRSCSQPPKLQKRNPRCISKKTMDCPHCKQRFVQQIRLKKHLLRCKVLHSKPPSSPKCESEFNNVSPDGVTLKSETDNERARRPSKKPNALPKLIKRCCPKCDNLTEITASLLYGKDKCTSCSTVSRLFQCAKCSKRYSHYDSARYHVSTKCSPEEYHQCTSCPYRTRIRSQLVKHTKRVHEKNNCRSNKLKCTKCGKEFKYAFSLNRHSKKLCGLTFPRNFIECDKCDRRFKDEGYLKAHEKVCGKEARLVCDYCGFESKYKQRLIAHLRKKHSDEKVSGK